MHCRSVSSVMSVFSRVFILFSNNRSFFWYELSLFIVYISSQANMFCLFISFTILYLPILLLLHKVFNSAHFSLSQSLFICLHCILFIFLWNYFSFDESITFLIFYHFPALIFLLDEMSPSGVCLSVALDFFDYGIFSLSSVHRSLSWRIDKVYRVKLHF